MKEKFISNVGFGLIDNVCSELYYFWYRLYIFGWDCVLINVGL